MTSLTRCARILALTLFAAVLSPQEPADIPEVPEPETRMPGQRSQREELLKQDHKKNLEEVARLLELVQGLKSELEKNDRHVLSVSSLRKAEEIEKLARSLRGRLKKF